MTNQIQLNNYFGNVWRQKHFGIEQYQYTGFALIDKIQEGERVIDIGCGANPFKGHIPNLIGIDPAFPEADVNLSLEDYVAQGVVQRFNVAFCLGSINFGTKENIEHQIDLVKQLLRTKGSRIYWRCNPGRKDHLNTECEDIEFYPWSFEEHVRLAELFNFQIDALEWDSNNRIYAEWINLNQ
jgi:hypothetical protein